MRRSPGGPPFTPFPPCSLSRILLPSSTPAGTVTASLRRARISPVPWQVGQRCEGTWPRPRHTGQGRVTANPPCPNEIVPRPEHSVHALNVAPGAAPLPLHVEHSSLTSSSMFTLPPSA